MLYSHKFDVYQNILGIQEPKAYSFKVANISYWTAVDHLTVETLVKGVYITQS